MVLGADRKGTRELFSIILQKYIKITWLTVQVKSHYNRYCGEIKLLNNIRLLTTNRARAKGTEDPRKKRSCFSIIEEKNTLCPLLNHKHSKPTMQTVQSYPHTMVLKARRIFRLCETKLSLHK